VPSRHRTCAKTRQSASWKEFIRAHMEVLAGMDFFIVEVLTWSGLATYYVLFLIHLESRRVTIAGITQHPTESWMEQMARNGTERAQAVCERFAMCFTIAIRSSALPLNQSLRPPLSSP
jgi:hypothetical protein